MGFLPNLSVSMGIGQLLELLNPSLSRMSPALEKGWGFLIIPPTTVPRVDLD